MQGIADENNGVVDHHARKADHADTRHENAKRSSGDNQADQHANHRQNDGCENGKGQGQGIELRNQNERDARQCDEQGFGEKGGGFLLFFIFTGIGDLIARWQGKIG